MIRPFTIASSVLLFSALLSAAITTTTTLSVTPAAPAFGQKVTLIASVTPATAPGFVSFIDRGVLVGSGTVSVGGVAQATTITLSGGPHSLVAVYGGNTSGGYSPSQSAAANFVVTAASGDGFAPAVNYGAASTPFSVVVGDFNGDGIADLAVANYGGNNVSVLLGNGNGTFQAAADYPAGSGPKSMAVGDFNADGIADLVVADYSGNNVSVLLGNGNGTFGAALSYGGGSAPTSVAVGDFNGDGKADLVVTDSLGGAGHGALGVMLGNGDGTFQPQMDYPAGTTPGYVAVGDFNGDGKADLAISNFGGSNMSVLIGNGDGTFQAAVNYAVGTGPDFVAVADFNGDGKSDLVVANDASGSVSVLLGNGDGTFGTAVSYPAGINPISIALGDFNGDGKADLAVANYLGGNVSVLLSNGNGTFQAAVTYTAGTSPYSVAVGDFNGDGVADLTVANSAGSNVSVLLGTPSVLVAPEPVSVGPGSGSGFTQTFTFSFTDPAGYADLSVLDILINNYLDGIGACYVAFVPASASSGYLYLVADAGGGYVSGTPALLPSSGSFGNSQCTINGSGSSVSASGDTLTLTLNITFTSGFAGNKIFFTAARSSTENSGWQALGTWNVPGPAVVGPGVGGVTPGRSVSTGETYTFTFTDSLGYGDLAVLDVLTNSFLDGISACYVAYVPTSASTGYLYLVADAGGGYAPGSPLLLSSGGTLSNSQCTINTAASSASASGNTLNLNLAITFSPSFAGNQVFFLAARNNTTGNSGWQAVGSVTVP